VVLKALQPCQEITRLRIACWINVPESVDLLLDRSPIPYRLLYWPSRAGFGRRRRRNQSCRSFTQSSLSTGLFVPSYLFMLGWTDDFTGGPSVPQFFVLLTANHRRSGFDIWEVWAFGLTVHQRTAGCGYR
jgi:hypothetical protein